MRSTHRPIAIFICIVTVTISLHSSLALAQQPQKAEDPAPLDLRYSTVIETGIERFTSKTAQVSQPSISLVPSVEEPPLAPVIKHAAAVDDATNRDVTSDSILSEVELDPVTTTMHQENQPLFQGESVGQPTVTSGDDDEDLTVMFGDWLGYNATQHDTTWLMGKADEFGMFSMESYPTLELGEDSSLMFGSGIHFLNGPVATDMPPRLFDFQTAYQFRKKMSSSLMIDAKAGVGAFSDFEGSARKGIRFPGHAVGYFQWDAWLVTLLGIEFLDRDDVSLLPVAGLVWRPRDDIVAELVFPRPRVQIKTDSNSAIYISGELGGGTWAVERADSTNDNATYRDLRLMLGIMQFGEDDDETALEIGWAFSRSLEYRSARGNYHPDDVFILRFRQHY